MTDLLTKVKGRVSRRSSSGKGPGAGAVHHERQQVELATITTADGTELAAEVHTSESGTTRGVIIFVHGFCGDKGENGLFDALAAQCVGEGFAAVLYNWRGIADSKGDFPSSTLSEHGTDFESVVQWTMSRFNTNIGLLHAVGFSLGAAVIGLALRRRPLLASVAYLSPASRPRQSMWPRYNIESIWSEVRKHGVAQKPGGSVLLGAEILESLRDTDLGPRAFDLKVPLLVCHGTDDSRIAFSHSKRLADQRKSDGAFRFIEFPGASHSFQPAADCWENLGHTLISWFDEASHPSTQNGDYKSKRIPV